MEPIKSYFTRSEAEADATKLMSNNIPSTIAGDDRIPSILSEFPEDQIKLLVPAKQFKRAEMILRNNDNIFTKIFKILTYKSYMNKQRKEERKQAQLNKNNISH